MLGKKCTAVFVAAVMVLVPAMEAFAYEGECAEDSQAAIMEDITGTEDICDDFYSTEEEIVVADGYDSVISIPREGDEEITLDDGLDNQIGISLPEMVSDEDGMLSDDGTVVYNDEESDVSIGVQALSEDIEGETIESVRALICIESADAPHDYSFDISVEDGERLVTAAEYLGEEFDTGEVYVVNDENEIVSVIDPAWAKDANEQPVNTYYTVDGNTLTQHVDFDENTAFPVVADPTAWQISLCVTAILAIAAPPLKLIKAIKAAGGIRKMAKSVIVSVRIAKKQAKSAGYKNWTRYVRVSKAYKSKIKSKFGAVIEAAIVEIIGVDYVIEKCSF